MLVDYTTGEPIAVEKLAIVMHVSALVYGNGFQRHGAA